MKYRKKELLQTVETLDRVNRMMKEATASKLILMGDVLAQCQGAAIEIGNYLEIRTGSMQPVVELLESYCENIYIQSQNLENPETCRKLAKKIQKQITVISNAIKFDLPEDRKEIVFLPYKASMWDSLESAYLKEKKNPDNDVYCIPIPYYDLNADHSFGVMHDERDQYPDNIVTTDWRTYRLEDRRPDRIYIHNPYDNWNHVTSVHPDFYATNLKKYTDQLIYVPYFVLGEVDPDDPADVERISHFCFLPGVIYADKVIVESENVKRIYVNSYLEEAAKSGLTGEHLDRKYLEEKIQGLGSPKYEKIRRTRREDLVIPKNWEKIFKRKDGEFKKIFFYNTGVSSLLQDEKRWVEKLEDTIETFRAVRNEIALLWRPHPLIESTMQAMRPEILQRYLKVKKQFQEEGWGIFDDSTDVDRAVVLSDVYYGDYSSVVHLYQETGKPVVIQNKRIRNAGGGNKAVHCLTADCDESLIWLMWDRTSTLIQYDLRLGKAIRQSSVQEKTTANLFLSSVKVEDIIYYAPYNAENMWGYNTKTDSWLAVDIGLTATEMRRGRKYNKLIYNEGKLYLFGEKLYHIAVYDIKTGLTKRYDQYVALLTEKGYRQEEIGLFNECTVHNEIVYFTSFRATIITAVNLRTMYVSMYDLKWDAEGLGGIAYDKAETFLVSDNRDNIIRWNENKGIAGYKQINALQTNEKYYQRIYCLLDKTLYFATYEDGIVIEYEHGERKIISLQKKENEAYPYGTYNQFGFIEKRGDSVFFQHIGLGKIFQLDTTEETVTELRVGLQDDVYMQIINAAVKDHDGKITESREFSLVNLMSAIQLQEEYVK